MTVPGAIEAGQVWEHRAYCRLCKTPAPHRHRYLILSVADEHAMVRDLTVAGSRIEPFARYARPLSLFGSFDKGGLRLAGHWERSRFEALPDGELDERLVEHERIPIRDAPHWRGKLPTTEALAA